MNDQRRFLLVLLAVVVSVSAVAVGVTILNERLTKIDLQIVRYRDAIETIENRLIPKEELEARKATIETAIGDRARIFYRPGEMDPYRFGILIRSTLVEYGMRVSGYRTIKPEGKELIEFTCSGDARDFVRFLRHVSSQDRIWILPSVELSRKEGGNVEVVMRIGYEEDGTDID